MEKETRKQYGYLWENRDGSSIPGHLERDIKFLRPLRIPLKKRRKEEKKGKHSRSERGPTEERVREKRTELKCVHIRHG